MSSWNSNLLKRAADIAAKDPYAHIQWDAIHPEKAYVFKFDGSKNEWTQSEHLIKIEDKPFAQGSMRTCYRMKKWSQFSSQPSWKNASAHVAKRYTNANDEEVHQKMVESDVKVQMVAKFYSELYNHKSPPKKIDVMQVFMIQLFERPGKPCYCVERFLDGEYIKYNSNIGYTQDFRNTPQAFSHFSFEESQGKLMIVDVQGVDDLYTDPQIHSIDEDEFGEGNLGVSGYAHFFHTHHCNPICKQLSLRPFDKYPFSATMTKLQKEDIEERSRKSKHFNVDEASKTAFKQPKSKKSKIRDTALSPVKKSHTGTPRRVSSQISLHSADDVVFQLNQILSAVPDTDDSLSSRLGQAIDNIVPLIKEFETRYGTIRAVAKNLQKLYHPSQTRAQLPGLSINVQPGQEDHKFIEGVLGQIHRSIARHFITNDLLFDVPASADEVEPIVMYHYKRSAEYGNIHAQLALSNLYEDRPNEIGVGHAKDYKLSFHYARMAALQDSKVGMIKMGHFLLQADLEGCIGFETGSKYKDAIDWFVKAVSTRFSSDDEESDSFELCVEDYELMQKIAQIYERGGYGVTRNMEKAADAYDEAGRYAEMQYKAKKALVLYGLAAEKRALIK